LRARCSPGQHLWENQKHRKIHCHRRTHHSFIHTKPVLLMRYGNSKCFQSLFSCRKKWRLIHGTTQMNLKTWCPGPDIEGTGCMIPLVLSVQKRPVHRGRKHVSGCQGLRGWLIMDIGFLLRVIKMLQNWLWW
jgi:hypothetical protein